MATTPEGRVKKQIKKVLDKYEDRIYYEMPVPGGYGRPTLDYTGSIRTRAGMGVAFAVEAKRPGEVPTMRQLTTMERMRKGGITVFTIDGEDGCLGLDAFLKVWAGA